MPPIIPASLLLVAPALAAAICALLVWWMVSRGWTWALDQPGARSLHSVATPRMGGLGLIAALLLSGGAIQALTGHWLWLETLCACVLCAVSLADDRHGLPVMMRLIAHLMVSTVYVTLLPGAMDAPLGWLIAAVLVIATFTNFFNFMDGANGIAGGMATIGFGAYALCAWPADSTLTLLCLVLAGAAAGFLPFNLAGRIFMGDGGSVPYGFLAGALGLYGWLKGAWPLWFAPLVFAPFLVDAGITLAKRMVRREPFWRAHRDHYYQRIVRMGWSHLRLACAEYALMLVCAGAALWGRRLDTAGQGVIFATISLLLLLLMLAIDVRWKHSPAPD